MKSGYRILLVFLIILYIAFVLAVLFTPIDQETWLDTAIQGTGIFAALLAGVIALHSADPKRKTLSVTIKASIDEDHIGPHKKAELPEGMLEQYKHLPDVFQSHRVLFRITNTSGFTLRQPTLTFRLPVTKQHPHQDRSSQTWITTFRSNLFNSQIDLKTLRFGDTSLLSNSNLPYWNDQETNTIWIRMVLAGGEVPPFEVTVSVNSENAEGVTKTVSIPTSLDH